MSIISTRKYKRVKYTDDGLRICNKCGIPQPEANYRETSRGNGSLESKCKSCFSENATKWNRENRKRRREIVQKWDNTHREQKNAKTREYRANNRDAVNQAAQEKYYANLEENRRKRVARAAKRRAKIASASGSFTAEEFKTKLTRYKNRCHWCGEKIKGTPHADHLIPLSKDGTNDIGNIVPSCQKCNLSKHARMPWEFNGRLL